MPSEQGDASSTPSGSFCHGEGTPLTLESMPLVADREPLPPLCLQKAALGQVLICQTLVRPRPLNRDVLEASQPRVDLREV